MCSLKPGKSRLSIQIANNSSHDVTLHGRTLLGRVNLVRSITPVQIGNIPQNNEACSNNGKDKPNPERKYAGKSESISEDIKKLPLDGLSKEQKEQVVQSLVAQQDAFAENSDDVCSIP